MLAAQSISSKVKFVAAGIFKKEFGENAKVWDREKIVIIPDHYIFTSDECANRNVDILRDFCAEQDIKYFYNIKDVGNFRTNPDYKGVCHVALAKKVTAGLGRSFWVQTLTRAMLELLGSLLGE